MNNFTNYRVFGICGDSALAFVQHTNRRSVYWCSVHNTFIRGHFLEGLSETIIVSMSFLTSSDEPGGGQTNKVMAFGCESREFKSSYRQVNVPVWEPCVVLGPLYEKCCGLSFRQWKKWEMKKSAAKSLDTVWRGFSVVCKYDQTIRIVGLMKMKSKHSTTVTNSKIFLQSYFCLPNLNVNGLQINFKVTFCCWDLLADFS